MDQKQTTEKKGYGLDAGDAFYERYMAGGHVSGLSPEETLEDIEKMQQEAKRNKVRLSFSPHRYHYSPDTGEVDEYDAAEAARRVRQLLTKKPLELESSLPHFYAFQAEPGKKIDWKNWQANATPEKAASAGVQTALQNLVFNCIDLSLLFKHCHWNAKGSTFKPLHDFLDEVYGDLVATSDDIAERLVTLGYPASGLVESVAARTAMAALPLKFMNASLIVTELTERLKSLCSAFNEAIESTKSDPVTSNMLQDMTHKLEKYLWMLRSQSESAETATKMAAHRAVARICNR